MTHTEAMRIKAGNIVSYQGQACRVLNTKLNEASGVHGAGPFFYVQRVDGIYQDAEKWAVSYMLVQEEARK